MTESPNSQQQESQVPGAPSRLTTLVDQAGVLMDQLTEISASQGRAIKAVEIDKIIEHVARREPVVAQLVSVGEEIEAVIGSIKGQGQAMSDSHQAALAKISTIEHAMKRLREQDVRDQQSMEAAREQLSSQLASTGTNQNALRAYSTRSSTPNPILQDRQG